MSRDARLARNEDHFRDINESLRDKHVHSTVVRSGPLPFVCECATTGCTGAVELTLEEYRRVRRDPQRFVLMPGHERPDLEVVVETSPRYVVVEKVGEAGAVARDASQ